MNTHAPEDVKRSPSAGNVESSQGEVTRLLSEWGNGDVAARDQLATIVYQELKRMAHRRLRRERIGHTMRTGTLAHEVCLRLIKAGGVKSRNREEFFGLARRLMEQILVDYARSRDTNKRGNGRV